MSSRILISIWSSFWRHQTFILCLNWTQNQCLLRSNGRPLRTSELRRTGPYFGRPVTRHEDSGRPLSGLLLRKFRVHSYCRMSQIDFWKNSSNSRFQNFRGWARPICEKFCEKFTENPIRKENFVDRRYWTIFRVWHGLMSGKLIQINIKGKVVMKFSWMSFPEIALVH